MNGAAHDLKAVAARALACLDLTNLNDDCSEADVQALCARAMTPHGPTAAVCIWPRFVPVAKKALAGNGIRIATVVAFPGGDDETSEVLDMTERAVAEGADEIDMVIPYKALMEGHANAVHSAVARVKEAAGRARVKAILETGVLGDAALIRQAAELAIEGGADFIKTSTGKVPVNATPEAARIMLEVIRDSGEMVGFKPAGGIRTTADAAMYLELCDEIMGPDWASPAVFRIGASSVLEALIATIEGRDGGVASAGGY
ncbi:deoxyribose-phosphate aldolase [Halovulum dunhuangense]|uniref:Deoxyribose-phosphate aldolase n=1 Tax=Halovulum dunhuangense TaxID=1505036 RepID=A0A849L4N2_9RHOB|nr:deoxyribose-phosphate aldolase [Halovulum dunhuangense]NNU81316.1 deoxyribose-phosphate aldolase [Halovulum dunhuangense]